MASQSQIIRTAFLSASLLALAACAPTLGPKPTLVAAADMAAAEAFAGPVAPDISARWWESYGDPQLNALVDEALAGSPDLAVASARLAQAEAAAQQAGAARLPSLEANGTAQQVRQSLNNGFPDEFKAFLPQGWNDQARLSASLRYQLDFFGRNRAALAAATSTAEAARADQAAAQLALSSGVAGAYAELKRLYAARAAAADAARVRGQTASFFADRRQAGLETRGPASQAAADAASARADVAALDGQILIARHEIAALLGKGPDRGLQIAEPGAQTLHPVGLPANLSADLIGRRPDVAAARARVEAAAQREKVAKTEFYPNIDLVGTYGLQSLPLDNLFERISQFGDVGPAISLPIFDGGARAGNYRGARGAYAEAVAVYNRTVANAFRETADAVANQRAAAAQLAEAREAVRASQDAYGVAQDRYGAGLVRNLDVLTAEGQLLAARRRVADLEAIAFNLDVALVRAIGGGYRAG